MTRLGLLTTLFCFMQLGFVGAQDLKPDDTKTEIKTFNEKKIVTEPKADVSKQAIPADKTATEIKKVDVSRPVDRNLEIRRVEDRRVILPAGQVRDSSQDFRRDRINVIDEDDDDDNVNFRNC